MFENKTDAEIASSIKKSALYVILLVVGITALISAVYIVPPTEMAGLRMLGKVETATPVQSGLHFKVPFIERADMLQTSQSKYTLEDMQVYTADNQSVDIGINVIYQIPSTAVMHLLYDVGRTGNVDIDGTILPVVRDRALATFARYNTLNISEKRNEIAMNMEKEIGTGLRSTFGINVIRVQLVKIKYSPMFVASVEAAVRAKAMAVQAENTVLQKQYEGQQQVVTAKALADAEIAKANGEAQARLINAAATAKSVKIIGDALSSNPQYLKYTQIKQWNGILPRVTGGAIPFISVGSAEQ